MTIRISHTKSMFSNLIYRFRDSVEMVWSRATSTALDPDTELGYRSRLLSGLLLAILVLGSLAEIGWMLRSQEVGFSDLLAIFAMLLISSFYLLNKRGNIWLSLFAVMVVLVLSIFVTGMFSYLVFPILLAGLFLSLRAYALFTSLILMALISLFPLADVFDGFMVMTIFAASVGVFKHHYQQLEHMRKWKLQESHQDLTAAYDATIAGWSNAMDLRDRETEGHSIRVTQLAIQLAGILGVSDVEQVHMHRGALLHDIGKLGIPDSILHKPGPLTDEEWGIMRQHPTFALNMLSPISYLQCALEIPYSHHERWDGSGYPLGLKGEQIPLAARIFAVVDVWDALTSDRPYRPAWPMRRAIQHIRDQAGKLFDPRVVRAFLVLMKPEVEDSTVSLPRTRLTPKFVTSPLAEILGAKKPGL